MINLNVLIATSGEQRLGFEGVPLERLDLLLVSFQRGSDRALAQVPDQHRLIDRATGQDMPEEKEVQL